jgi:hypothetical protein
MSPFVAGLWIIIGGFFAGAIEVMLVSRAARLLASLLGKNLPGVSGPAPKRRAWAIPLLILHPASIVLMAMFWLSYLLHAGRVAPPWGWFLGAFFVCIFLMYGAVFLVFSRAKRKVRLAGGPQSGRQP